MYEIEIRCSMLPTYETCERMFAASWLIENSLSYLVAPDLIPKGNNVGSSMGTSCHSSFAFLMSAFAITGEHGGNSRRDEAIEVALDHFEKIDAEGIDYDDVTQTGMQARRSISTMVAAIHRDVRPDAEPILIEQGVKSSIKSSEGIFILKGTLDLFLIDDDLTDLKTGKTKPAPYAQMGGYRINLSAHGYKPKKTTMLFVQRPKPKDKSTSVERVAIDSKIAEQQAFGVAKAAHASLSTMLRTGDKEVMVANPSTPLCHKRFCPAYGTSFCPIGQAVNPRRT